MQLFYLVILVINNPLTLQLRLAGLTSTCLQTEVKHHPASIRVTCQHVEFPSHCWLSRVKLSLQISSYPNSSLFWFGTNLKHLKKSPPPWIEPAPHPVVRVQSGKLEPRGRYTLLELSVLCFFIKMTFLLTLLSSIYFFYFYCNH